MRGALIAILTRTHQKPCFRESAQLYASREDGQMSKNIFWREFLAGLVELYPPMTEYGIVSGLSPFDI